MGKLLGTNVTDVRWIPGFTLASVRKNRPQEVLEAMQSTLLKVVGLLLLLFFCWDPAVLPWLVLHLRTS